jgi:hypothetical protein
MFTFEKRVLVRSQVPRVATEKQLTEQTDNMMVRGDIYVQRSHTG